MGARGTPRPGLVTGTSSEFIGAKPLPRILRQRRVAFFVGPQGVGKSTVARLLAGSGHVYVSTRTLSSAMLARVRTGQWPDRLLRSDPLVLDGPVSLRHRQGAVQLLHDLAVERARSGHRTLFCESDRDGSIERLIASMDVGTSAVIGLRFPKGRRARLRCARRVCQHMGLPEGLALGSDTVEPWTYDRVVSWMVERTWRTS